MQANVRGRHVIIGPTPSVPANIPEPPMPQPGAAGDRNGKRGQSSNIAFPHDCNEKQRWLNVLDLAVCALLRSARRSPIQIFDD
jgi:hypothetical protein